MLLLTYLLRPSAVLYTAWAIDNKTLSHSGLGCFHGICPVGTLPLQFCLSVSPPAISRPTYPPFLLGIPSQDLTCDGRGWPPEEVPNPAPLPTQDLLGDWFSLSPFSKIYILNLFVPLYIKYASQTGVKG